MMEYWDEAKKALSDRDPVLGKIIVDYPGEGLVPRGDIFYTLVRAIAGQQISVKAAQSTWDRLEQRVGRIEPPQLLKAGKEALRQSGLSNRKAEYIFDIALEGEALLSNPWETLPDEVVVDRLCALRGVGPWTAQMVLIFALGRPDILPLADIGLIRAVEKSYTEGRRLSEREVLAYAKPWRPWRSVATWYLWRSLDPNPVEY